MRRLLQIIPLFILAFLFISCGGDDNGTPNPEITGLQPDSGPPGTMVTIEGKGFSPEKVNNSVTFGGTSASVNSANESSIETKVPEGLESGSAQVNVSIGEQTATGPSFMVEAKAPGISSVDPDNGPVGTDVTIKGMNFSPTTSENTITFNGTEAPINGAAADQLKTEVPQGATDGPIKVTVKQKSTTGPDFDVITEGTLEAIISTSGSDKDSDGYELTVDGANSTSTAVSDSVYVAGIEQGSHEVQLSGLSGNCSLSDLNPRTVNITAGDTTSTIFDVSCQAVANNRIAFHSDRSGNFEIYLMRADGSNPKKLTDNSSDDAYPVISNDGTKIAFFSDRNASSNGDLFVMNADGSNVQQITSSSGQPLFYSWSPDDSKIVYYDNRSGNQEIYVVNSDGSGGTQLTNNSSTDVTPDWSPDGSKIVFSSARNGDLEIFTMKPDGTNVQQVASDTTSDEYLPQWSPDGSKFSFVTDRNGNDEIYTMNSDGTGLRRITNNSAGDGFPSWSADGSELIFSTDRDGNEEIYKVNADGSGTLINLTVNSAIDEAPSWSPVK